MQHRISDFGKLASSTAYAAFSVSRCLLFVLFSAPKLAADFLKKQELRKAKSEGTKTVINIGSPVCFQEFSEF
jgi:hypothetical protein